MLMGESDKSREVAHSSERRENNWTWDAGSRDADERSSRHNCIRCGQWHCAGFQIKIRDPDF